LTNSRGGWVERAAIVFAVLFLGVLALLEFTIYRPQQQKLDAAEADLKSLQDQLAGVARRNLSDQELFLYAGTAADGAEFKRLYSSESGVVFLTRMIGASGLERTDFTTEVGRQDGMFRVEVFSVILKGSYPRSLAFLKALEGGPRLVRVEAMGMQPVMGSSEILLSVRAAIYTLSSREPQ
jgi:Tfp pilus assembly protein PilO